MSASTDHARQAALIEAMLQPRFYPHDTEPEIRLVQTHLSYVVLTGPFAYKINKCVQFNFVDYSTLAKRRHFCEEEIRLNCLYAPDLYLDVVAILETENGFTLTEPSDGDAVEFAVRMNQFRDDDLLLHAFERGDLTESDVEFIARQLARFHREAKCDATISAYGAPSIVSAMVQENYESLAPFTGRLWAESGMNALRTYTDSVLRDCNKHLERRVNEGRIRECHGDLHLGNICFYDGNIEFFDRVVFNETFKNIDVMYDLAFLYMDLEHRRRSDLANRLLNSYLEESNDFDGVPLLRFYACCRAQIRSKVFALESREKEIPPAEQAKVARSAKSYFDLALQYAVRSKTGDVILMCGVSGSGKSTVARQLSARTSAIRIRSDAVRKHLSFGLPDQIYTPEMSKRTYAFMIQMGVQLALAGYPIVLDATFGDFAQRQRAIAECCAQRLDVRIVHCVADTDVLRDRVDNRTNDVSDADLSVLERQLKTFEALNDEEQTRTIKLDTTEPIDYDMLVRNNPRRTL